MCKMSKTIKYDIIWLLVTSMMLMLPFIPASNSFFREIVDKLGRTSDYNCICPDIPNNSIIMVYQHFDNNSYLLEFLDNSGNVYGYTASPDSINTLQIESLYELQQPENIYYQITDELIKQLRNEVTKDISHNSRLMTTLDKGLDNTNDEHIILSVVNHSQKGLDSLMAFYRTQEQKAVLVDGTQELYLLSQKVF